MENIVSAIHEFVSDNLEGWSRKPSSEGYTYYVDKPESRKLAFMTVQPNRGKSFVYIHLDGSVKQSVLEPPLETAKKSGQFSEIPSNWKWKGSFKYTVELRSTSDISNDVRQSIIDSFEQVDSSK